MTKTSPPTSPMIKIAKAPKPVDSSIHMNPTVAKGNAKAMINNNGVRFLNPNGREFDKPFGASDFGDVVTIFSNEVPVVGQKTTEITEPEE